MDGTVARRLLAVDPGATRDELQRAYRQRSKSLHPDLGGDPDAFVELRRAYEHLVAFAPATRPRHRYDRLPTSDATTWHVYDAVPRRRIDTRQQRTFAEVLAAALA
jgi:DnaJ-class molecular chaperone